MRDPFDTSQSNDSDSDAHWDAVAARVTAQALRRSREGAFGWFARSRATLVAASILLVAALASMLPSAPPAAERAEVEWAEALVPTDELGRAVARDGGPPAIDALLLGGRDGAAR
jgi:hypothetical protein